jgi:hypothetical protein
MVVSTLLCPCLSVCRFWPRIEKLTCTLLRCVLALRFPIELPFQLGWNRKMWRNLLLNYWFQLGHTIHLHGVEIAQKIQKWLWWKNGNLAWAFSWKIPTQGSLQRNKQTYCPNHSHWWSQLYFLVSEPQLRFSGTRRRTDLFLSRRKHCWLGTPTKLRVAKHSTKIQGLYWQNFAKKSI